MPAPDTGSARDDLATVLDFARLRFDPSVTGTLLTEEREHPELLEAARHQMIVPAIDRFRRVLRAGIERGELRSDLDVDAAAHALLGSFFIRYLEHGRPRAGWAEGIVEALWPAFAAPASTGGSAPKGLRPRLCSGADATVILSPCPSASASPSCPTRRTSA